MGKNEIFQNCRIGNVKYQDSIEHLTFDIFDSKDVKLDTVRVSSRGIHSDIRRLLKMPGFRLFWAFGMTDIDIYWSNEGSFAIEVSPYAGIYTTYIVSESELRKLLCK